jgi:hypothetical protein
VPSPSATAGLKFGIEGAEMTNAVPRPRIVLADLVPGTCVRDAALIVGALIVPTAWELTLR